MMRWLFVRSSPKCWSWRKLATTGRTLSESPEFADFGVCVHDAIGNGLDARKDDWSVSDIHAVTHFAPAAAPRIVPKSGSVLPPRAASDRASVATDGAPAAGAGPASTS